MNCTEFRNNFDSENIELIRKCYPDGPTIILTLFIMLIFSLISCFTDN